MKCDRRFNTKSADKKKWPEIVVSEDGLGDKGQNIPGTPQWVEWRFRHEEIPHSSRIETFEAMLSDGQYEPKTLAEAKSIS